MRRTAGAVLTAVQAAVAVALAASWAVDPPNTFVGVHWRYVSDASQRTGVVSVNSRQGRLELTHCFEEWQSAKRYHSFIRNFQLENSLRLGGRSDFDFEGRTSAWRDFGVRRHATQIDRGLLANGWSLTVPIWVAIALALIHPAIRVTSWVFGRRRAARELRGECPNCGYDLRASPGGCPECGLERDANGSAKGRGTDPPASNSSA